MPSKAPRRLRGEDGRDGCIGAGEAHPDHLAADLEIIVSGGERGADRALTDDAGAGIGASLVC